MMGHWDELRRDKQRILDVRREESRREGPVARLITRAGDGIAHPLFFLFAVALHLAWIVANVPEVSPLEPWDPPPFDLLSTLASVEAPLLALLILMRQQQDRRVEELREEIDLQTSLHVERETSAIIRLISGAGDDVPHLEALKEPLDPEELLRSIRSAMQEEGPGQD